MTGSDRPAQPSVIAGCATEGFPADADHASICAYFWVGMSLGIKTPENSIVWADSVIQGMDSPPTEIIEIATGYSLHPAMDALKIGARTADWQNAGRWLLLDTSDQLMSGDLSAADAVCRAKSIADMTEPSQELWQDLFRLEDRMNPISPGVASAEEIKIATVNVLLKYGSARSG